MFVPIFALRMGVSSRIGVLWPVELDGSVVQREHGLVEGFARVLGLSHGEAIDWDAEMRKHGHRVVLGLIARGIRPERAKELAQDAWMRVIERHREGRLAELRLPGVVITQAGFLALDEQRRGERRFVHESFDEHDASARPIEPLERQLEAREQLRAVQRILADSHPNVRRVFDLMYGGEARSATEIAAQLGLSVQRVRQIACELRQRVRRAIEGGGSGDAT